VETFSKDAAADEGRFHIKENLIIVVLSEAREKKIYIWQEKPVGGERSKKSFSSLHEGTVRK